MVTNNMSLKAAKTFLDASIHAIGGENAAFEACERMYSATFRSEPIKLSTLEEWEDEVSPLYSDVAISIYVKETNQKLPVQPNTEASEYELDSYYAEMECLDNSAEKYMKKHYPEFNVTGDTLVVALCNYKGETSGYGVCDIYEHLSVYRSKSESFNQANKL
jgi:hypothetical protein